MSNVIKIKKKNWPVFVIPTLVKDLDVSKCSKKFITLNFPSDMIVYVKCHENGEIDLRGKREEYRIIPKNIL